MAKVSKKSSLRKLSHYFQLTGTLLLLILLACNSPEKKKQGPLESDKPAVKQEIVPGRISDRITTDGAAYSLYVPMSFSEKEKYPVMVFFDPHGKGNVPIENYARLAEKFQFILLGSNDSKNGMGFEESINIASKLIREIKTNLPSIPDKISIAGFSGGAKAALVSGNTVDGFSSVIYCGAALQLGSIQTKKPGMGIAGEKDMNFTEVRNYNFPPELSIVPHTLVEWKGKHEWPDTNTFTHAFYWSLFIPMKNDSSLRDPKTVDAFRLFMKQSIADEKNVLVKALLLRETIDMLEGIDPVDNYIKQLAQVRNSSAFKDAKQKENVILANEVMRKQQLIQSFESEDLTWWTSQISKLASEKNNESNQRLLGYISLAAWTYSSKAIAANSNEIAAKALEIYKLADPENSEQPFLKACLYSNNGMPDSAMYFLNEAAALGLNDRNKILMEKAFASIRNRNDFQNLLSKMK